MSEKVVFIHLSAPPLCPLKFFHKTTTAYSSRHSFRLRYSTPPSAFPQNAPCLKPPCFSLGEEKGRKLSRGRFVASAAPELCRYVAIWRESKTIRYIFGEINKSDFENLRERFLLWWTWAGVKFGLFCGAPSYVYRWRCACGTSQILYAQFFLYTVKLLH